MSKKLVSEIKQSEYFDASWYLNEYPDVSGMGMCPAEHYISYGWKLGRNPSKKFDTEFYISTNPDLKNEKINPLEHYLVYGKKEGRLASAREGMVGNGRAYKRIIDINDSFHVKIKKNELGVLLDQATALREVGMLETYIGIVRYMTIKFDNFIDRLQNVLLMHIKNVIVVSKDRILIEYLIENRIDIFMRLDISNELIDDVMGVGKGRSGILSLDKKSIYENHEGGEEIHQFIKNSKNPGEILNKNPELYCAVANSCISINKAAVYKGLINGYLREQGLPLLNKVDFDQTNILKSMEFKLPSSVQDERLVTVIMSAFNAEETIEYAINSLLVQTYSNIEILVCDDRSTDKTLAILKEISKKDSRINVFSSIDNQGTYNIRNYLIEKSRGEFITFQDSDDVALPNRIEEQVSCLSESNKDICFARWIRIQPDGKFVFFFDGMLKRFCVVSAMAKKSFITKLSNFRESLVAADTEFYEECKNVLGEEGIAHIDKPLLVGLWGDGSLTKQENLTAENCGFVAARRRGYSEVSARQRVLGKDIVKDSDVIKVLKNLNIHRDPKGVRKHVGIV